MLANNTVATTNNTSQQQGTTETKDQTNKPAKARSIQKSRSNYSCSWL